ncbi:response regulator transcription factor [Chloroflexota bacterium]
MDSSILIVEENNKGLRDRMAVNLAREGFRVTTATDCEDALLKLGEAKPELVILGDGLLVDSNLACRQLRQRSNAIILMLGADPSGESWTSAVAAGADFYLVRPFSSLELVARVKNMLRRYKLTRDNGYARESDHVEV